jgi:hypothetical protein
VRSLFHHLLVCGDGFDSGTTCSITSVSAFSSLASVVLNVSRLCISLGGGSARSLLLSCPRNSSQSTILQFLLFGVGAAAVGRLIVLRMGRWSALGGRLAGATSHLIKASRRDSDANTLSGLVQFLDRACWWVGMSFGRAIFIPCSAMRSSRGWVFLRSSSVNR